MSERESWSSCFGLYQGSKLGSQYLPATLWRWAHYCKREENFKNEWHVVQGKQRDEAEISHWACASKLPSHMLNEAEQPFFLQIVLLSVRFGLDPVRSCWAMPGLTKGRFWNLSCIKYSCPNWRMQCTPILSYLGWVSKKEFVSTPFNWSCHKSSGSRMNFSNTQQ